MNIMKKYKILKYSKKHQGEYEPSKILSLLTYEAVKIRGVKPVKEVSFYIKNEKNKVIAAVIGYIFYGSLLIDILWVQKSFRRRGLGMSLLTRIEKEAINKGLSFSVVTTMDWWEAVPFYKSFGYEIEFIREGYENESKLYSLKKKLI